MYSFFRKLRLAKMDVMNMTVIKLLAFLGLVAYMCYFFRRVSLFMAMVIKSFVLNRTVILPEE